MNKIYLVVGTPGSGKSWVCNQLADKFDYLPHDKWKDTASYLENIKVVAALGEKPVLIETPFSVSQIFIPLIEAGLDVHPVFIIESAETTARRYQEREGKEIPKGHLTRIQTYAERAREHQAFAGTSEQVLHYLEQQA